MSAAVGHATSERDYNHVSDDNYKRFRDLASQEHSKEQECFSASQAAYKKGDGAEAKRLSEQGKQHANKKDEYNQQAAQYVFRANNADSEQDEIDLHGLFVKEALAILETRIQAAYQNHESHLDVIVGKGIHSKDGVAKLKPAVEELCQKHNFKYALDPKNSGVIVIDFTSPGQGQVDYNQLAPRPQRPNRPNNHGYQGQQHQPNYHQQPQYQNQQSNYNNNNDEVNILVKIFCGLVKAFCK